MKVKNSTNIFSLKDKLSIVIDSCIYVDGEYTTL